VFHRNVDVAGVALVEVERSLAARANLFGLASDVRVAPNVNGHRVQLRGVFFTDRTASSLQSDALLVLSLLALGAAGDVGVRLSLRLIGAELEALLASAHECEGLMGTAFASSLGICAEVEAYGATARVGHRVVSVHIAHLFEVKERLFGQLVARV